MRIISKFKDYYDSGAGYGVDMERVYLRETVYNRDLSIDSTLFTNDIFCIKSANCGYEPVPRGYWSEGRGVLIVAGKAYDTISADFIRTNIEKKSRTHMISDSQPQIPRDQTDFIVIDNEITFTEERWQETPKRVKVKLQIGNYSKRNAWIKRYIKGKEYKLANELTQEEINKIHLEAGSPIVHIKYDEKRSSFVTTNVCLQNLGFNQVIDPYTCFQEIEMYISSLLVQDMYPPSAPMSEKEKVKSKGFDEKYGFRKRPTK